MDLIKCKIDDKVVYLDRSEVVNVKDRSISLFKITRPVFDKELDCSQIDNSNRFSDKEVI